jgi:hypothetical protein
MLTATAVPLPSTTTAVPSPNHRRCLYADGLAAATTVVSSLAVASRLKATLDERAGTFYPILLYMLAWGMAALPLLLAALRPQLYYRWRMPLCLTNRALRLALQAWNTSRPHVAQMVSRATVVRSVSFAPGPKAMVLLLLHPTIYFMPHALHLLPWRTTLAFQLCSTALAMTFCANLPGYLQRALLNEGAQDPVPVAERVCSMVRAAAALVVAGSADHDLRANQLGSACQGVAALQVLHAFFTICCLTLLPVAAAWEVEHWLTARGNQPPTRSHSSSVSAGSSSTSSTSTGSSTRSASRLSFVAGGSSSSVDSGQQWLEGLPAAVEPLSSRAVVCFIAVPAVLSLTWLLAELLTAFFNSRVAGGDLVADV